MLPMLNLNHSHVSPGKMSDAPNAQSEPKSRLSKMLKMSDAPDAQPEPRSRLSQMFRMSDVPNAQSEPKVTSLQCSS